MFPEGEPEGVEDQAHRGADPGQEVRGHAQLVDAELLQPRAVAVREDADLEDFVTQVRVLVALVRELVSDDFHFFEKLTLCAIRLSIANFIPGKRVLSTLSEEE